MISYFLESVFKVLKSRIFILCAIFTVFFVIMIARLFDLQIVNEQQYMDTYVQKAKKEIYTAGTRGEIKDRNGNVLACNKLAYNITIEDQLESSYDKSDKLNEIIYKAVTLIRDAGSDLNNDFPIAIDKDDNLAFTFTSESLKKTFLINIYGRDEYNKNPDGYQNMSAAEVYDYLSGEDKYDIKDSDLTKSDKLNIISVRYNLSLNAYAKYLTTTIASNVNDETVAAIYEHENELTGVSVAQDTVRIYNDSIYFAPILGYTGRISEDELATKVADGKDYINSDMIGKAGIESAMEDYLQGTKGYTELFVNSTGKVVSEISSTEAVSGNDVYLTIDKDTQIAAYNLLEQKIAGVLISHITPNDVDKDAIQKAVLNNENVSLAIPVKDVYFQLINNNVVDISNLNEKKSSANSKNIYSKFQSRLKTVSNTLRAQLEDTNSKKIKNQDAEYRDYQSYVYTLLENDGLLLSSMIDTSDETYTKYINKDISLRDFLYYAISKEWINVSKLNVNSKYSTSDDIYSALLNSIFELAKSDKGFAKLLYEYMINSEVISGSEVCMLLYDQDVFKYNDTWYTKLSANNKNTAYSFIIEQINNLTITPAQIALEPCSGSIVLTDPSTGQVTAMVTYPSYDNNEFSGRVDADYWAKLIDDKSNPLYSRSTQSVIAPGSTFKMISAITGLENGVITADETIEATGLFDKIHPSAKCWIYPGAHGSLNVIDAIGVSCNCFFYEVGYRLATDIVKTTDKDGNEIEKEVYNDNTGLEKIQKYATSLGLNMKSGIEITENDPLFSTDSAVRSAIGQGSHGYTNVQLARYAGTLANRGDNYALTLIQRVDDKMGKVVYKQEPKLEETNSDISSGTWNAVIEGMKAVTTLPNGTVGNVFSDIDYKVAGKTGTAQENKTKFDHALFIGFAPADDPKFAISVIIPYGDSSSYSAEVAHDVMKYMDGDLSLKKILKGKANTPTSEKVGD